MYQHILIPSDGSEPASSAIDHGLTIANAFDAVVHAVSVVESPAEIQRDQLRTDPEDLAEQATTSIESEATERGIIVQTATPTGMTADAILQYANDHDIDLIVMGTHGRSGVGRVVFGSIAEEVVRNAEVPVLTVRPPA